MDHAGDAAAIIHELGDGLHNWVTGGHGLSGFSFVEGLFEGVGDYLEQSYCRSLDLWNASDPAYYVVSHWGGLPSIFSRRTTN